MKANAPFKSDTKAPDHPSLTRFGAVITRDGTIVLANDHWAQDLPPASANISKRNIFDLLPGDNRAFLKKMLNQADRCKSSQASSLNNGKPGDLQWEVIKLIAAGSTTPVYLCLIPLHDAGTKKLHDGGQLNKCKALDERTASGVILHDEIGSILWANEKAARLLGVLPNELFTPHFLVKLWKTYHNVHSSVPFEEGSPSGSGQPGLLPSSATLVIKESKRNYKTLTFGREAMFPQSVSSPGLILARLKEVMGKEVEKTPIISGLTDGAWVRRAYIDQIVARAIEGERVRLGHELHDNINQMLSVILVYLSLLHPADPDEKGLRDKAERILQLAIEEIRGLSHRLVKDSPLREGFIAAATGLVAEFQDARLFNITFTCGSREVETMDQSKKLALYRILQEHLNNIVKYSHAKNVQICLDSDEKGVRLTIEDDGVGFNKLTVQKGIGLTGIYEKAEQCNGSVELLTSPGHGCVLTVTAPQGVSEN